MDLEIVLIIFIVLAGLASLYSFTIITIDLIAEIKQKNAEKKMAEAEKNAQAEANDVAVEEKTE